MVYLFIGGDLPAKDKHIEQLKQKTLPTHEARTFDAQTLHGQKLEPAELKKSLMALPAAAPKRFVLIRAVHKLSAQNKDIVLDHIRLNPGHVVLALDTDEETEDAFIKKIIPQVKCVTFMLGPKEGVFDMTKAIGMKSAGQALKILDGLLEQGLHPLQIMPALVWFWGSMRRRLSPQRYNEGLVVLQEADWNIKRSKLKAENALEVSVVKLCSLIA